MDAVSYSHSAKQAQRIKKIIENPDSASGIVTVPKVIASGETVTIPAGRVAVLPNMQVDGVLNIEGEVFIPSGATLGDLDAQIALKADTSYVNTQLGLKANTTDLKEIGVGQTWQDVTASRASGVTYTNSTGKPILVSVVIKNTAIGGACNVFLQAGSIELGHIDLNDSTSSGAGTLYGIIPNGDSYTITIFQGQVEAWSELR